MSMLDADDDTMCAMAIGKWLSNIDARPEGHRCCCCFASLHYSIVFNSSERPNTKSFQFSMFSIIESESENQMHGRTRATQKKRRSVEMREVKKGLVWALPCVLIECIIIKKLSVCDNGGWQNGSIPKKWNMFKGRTNERMNDDSNRHNGCNYLPKFTFNGLPFLLGTRFVAV